ncbi:flagellar type III secretion system protein FliR [Parashewanella spongiae]|uniref:Flagellar biosynthetic protein FliR n=1 Tax=Parashewanella spongiae TaxID=342950 RepID=A0A3A6UD34_9GAMM|nr:flagellar biosynthetic protein FliR [Parashewanella spongiae]MCL1076644.1 flagellar type III secretion system protein FliR [Parashewanella spongiae]RJY19597.1 flagellar type III secretion system protein FliR [Parashewanella spongiae]
MEILMSTINQTIAGYMWPLFRISSMLMVMAIFGANTTPARVRLLLSVAITIAIAPILPPMPNTELFSLPAVFITAQQILIGVAMGFVSLMLMNTFVLTGQIIGMQTSLGFASMVDPGSGQQVPAVGNFFLILSTFIFLAVDGHLLMLKMLIASFETIPVSENGINIANYRAMAYWGSYMFGAALTMSISAILALLLINLSFGVMTRAAPQLNIFSIGFPITMLSGLLILWLTLTPIMAHFGEVWNSAQGLMCDMLELTCKVPPSTMSGGR